MLCISEGSRDSSVPPLSADSRRKHIHDTELGGFQATAPSPRCHDQSQHPLSAQCQRLVDHPSPLPLCPSFHSEILSLRTLMTSLQENVIITRSPYLCRAFRPTNVNGYQIEKHNRFYALATSKSYIWSRTGGQRR